MKGQCAAFVWTLSLVAPTIPSLHAQGDRSAWWRPDEMPVGCAAHGSLPDRSSGTWDAQTDWFSEIEPVCRFEYRGGPVDVLASGHMLLFRLSQRQYREVSGVRDMFPELLEQGVGSVALNLLGFGFVSTASDLVWVAQNGADWLEDKSASSRATLFRTDGNPASQRIVPGTPYNVVLFFKTSAAQGCSAPREEGDCGLDLKLSLKVDDQVTYRNSVRHPAPFQGGRKPRERRRQPLTSGRCECILDST